LVYLGGIPAEHMRLEAYSGPVNNEGHFASRQLALMQPQGPLKDGWQAYTATVAPEQAGRFGLTVRATPVHPFVPDPYSLGLICWAS